MYDTCFVTNVVLDDLLSGHRQVRMSLPCSNYKTVRPAPIVEEAAEKTPKSAKKSASGAKPKTPNAAPAVVPQAEKQLDATSTAIPDEKNKVKPIEIQRGKYSESHTSVEVRVRLSQGLPKTLPANMKTSFVLLLK